MLRAPSTFTMFPDMKCRSIGFALLIVSVVLGGCGRKPKPDIVIITIDTLRADHLGCYGYASARTPTIDALAAKGRLYSNAFTPVPRTTPALASMLTGLEPHHHGSREVGMPVKSGELLSEVLTAEGYQAACVTASGVAGPDENLARGYMSFNVLNKALAETVTDEALSAWKGMREDQPRFLWVHYWDPHTPYDPPAPWAEQADDVLCRQLHQDYYSGKVALGLIFSDYQGVASEARDSCVELYDAEIAYTDHEVGRLIEGLPEAAVLVVASDHGESFGEDGLYYEHGPSIHHAGIHVPLVIKAPGFSGKEDRPASLVDIMPTLLELADIPRRLWPEMDGQSLLSLSEDRPLFFETASALQPEHFTELHSGRRDALHCLNHDGYSLCGEPGKPYGLYSHRDDVQLEQDLSSQKEALYQRFREARKRWPPEDARSRAVLLDGLKLIRKPLFEGGYTSRLVRPANDPMELENLSDAYPDELENMERLLDDWTGSIPPLGGTDERDASAVQRLRSLGYTR